MNILSIDIGIKNLACCILHVDSSISIVKWDVLNLIPDKLCSKCSLKASYLHDTPKTQDIDNQYFCKRHAKSIAKEYPHKYCLPSQIDNIPSFSKLSSREAREILANKCIPFRHWFNKLEYNKEIINCTKTELIKLWNIFKSDNLLQLYTKINASKYSFMDLGYALINVLDNWINDISINITLIENQISPIANRMKTLQGMVTQYMIMRHNCEVEYISSSNKLKVQDWISNTSNTSNTSSTNNTNNTNNNMKLVKEKTNTYAKRKKLGIQLTKNILEQPFIVLLKTEYKLDLSCSSLLPYFCKHKKQDDLADAFLQGVWWIGTKLR